ncbi:MAG: hypothetical protein AAF483_25035 [Planctomycetota bacterium]
MIIDLFHRENLSWRLKQKLQPLGAVPASGLGAAIVMDEGLLIAGAPGTNVAGPESGAVYIFELQGGVWKQTNRISASDSHTRLQFGNQLSLSGNRLAVGCANNNTFGKKAGAVYMFEQLANGEWQQRNEPLYAIDAREDSHFGTSVCLSGDRLLVGADNTSFRGGESGSAYLYFHDGTDWQHSQKLEPKSNASTYKQHFGRTVAVHEDRLYIAAPSEYRNSGAVYVFDAEDE